MSTDHGRQARRTIKAALALAWIESDGAAQVAQVRRTVTRNGKKTVEVVYLITSDRAADPATLAAWARGHWHIEDKLHWVLSFGVARVLRTVALDGPAGASAARLWGCGVRRRCCS